MMGPAHCRVCGDPVAHNPKAVGRISQNKGATNGQVLTGWHHDVHGSVEGYAPRDHQAAPHDMRSPEVEAQRVGEAKSFARMQIDHHLGKQFDQLDMEHAVNDVFHDRR